MNLAPVEGMILKQPFHPGAIGGRIALSIVTLILLSAAVQSTQGAETLRWKFKPGETLKYTMVQSITQESKAMGQEIKTSLSQTVDMHWSVKNVGSDGAAEMSQTIDRVRTKVEAPNNNFEFDSQDAKENQGQIAAMLTPMLKALVGAEFSFKMNGRGELSDIKVPPKLLESLRQAGPGGATGMFSEEGMKNLISQSSLTMPEGPMDKGKTWTQQAKVPVPTLGTMIMDKTYTFDGPSSKEASLDRIMLDTQVTLEPAADSNIAAKITSQKGTGEFDFDPQAGRVVSSKVNDKLQMSLSVMGQQLEQTTDTVTSMTLTR